MFRRGVGEAQRLSCDFSVELLRGGAALAGDRIASHSTPFTYVRMDVRDRASDVRGIGPRKQHCAEQLYFTYWLPERSSVYVWQR